MNPDFLRFLACPVTGEPLRLEVEDRFPDGMVKSGSLSCDAGRRRYPVVRGIPRFVVGERYAGSFGYEWRRWSTVQFDSRNEGTPMDGYTRRMFERATGLGETEIRGRCVVEFGCGPGRFLETVRAFGGSVVGIDMSMAVEPAGENFRGDPSVLIVQGDILAPPFRKGAFDAGYSIGVLHHTPDPAAGLRSLAGTVREGGVVACCVYPLDGLYGIPAVSACRKVHRAVSPLVGNRAALAYAWISAHILYHLLRLPGKTPGLRRLVAAVEKYLLVNVDLPDARWRMLDVFDAITPQFASTHTEEEVRSWFTAAGCEAVRRTAWCSTSLAGIKAGPGRSDTLPAGGGSP